MVLRQTEPPRAQVLPTEKGTQRQVFMIDSDESPATTSTPDNEDMVADSGTSFNTTQTWAQLVTSEGTATLRDPSIAATRAISETAHEETIVSATPQLAATGSRTAPTTMEMTNHTSKDDRQSQDPCVDTAGD
jgi:hypothetical protein